MLVPTDGEAQDVFGGRESKAELSGVVTDDLKQGTQTASQTGAEKSGSAAASERNCCVWGSQDMRGAGAGALTCLSNSRRAYLMLGSCKVMAGLLLEKNSLKIRLMMPSKPPRISCGAT